MPHPLPYQGSKRKLAPFIAQYVPPNIGTMFEPFCGSAAFTLYAAENNLASHFVIGDSCAPIVDLWKLIINDPQYTAEEYGRVWLGQDDTYEYFNSIRARFNQTRDPILFLFLAARCVANAIRFNAKGDFTQSQDKRRKGTHPDRMANEIYGASKILRGRTTFFCGDFSTCIENASINDLVYMDPPYQGTSEGPDKRYFSSLERARLELVLQSLNERNVPFLVSYDGMHGEKTYGQDLPARLNATKLLVQTGRSTQGTLNGNNVITKEGLYVSHQLAPAERGQLAMAF
jgi:DNA adenine methylase